MHSGLMGSRRHARWVYTLRGMLWATMLYPLLFAACFLVGTAIVERPGWQPPHIRH